MKFAAALVLFLASILTFGLGFRYLNATWEPLNPLSARLAPIAFMVLGIGMFHVAYRLLLASDRPRSGRGKDEVSEVPKP